MAGSGAREKRRSKRELVYGPKQKVISRENDNEKLECGHIVECHKLTTHPPKLRRCIHCLTV